MIYQRHIINILIPPLIITLAVIVCFVWLSQFMKLAYIIELGAELSTFFLLTSAVLPSIALTAFPLATIVAFFLGYNRLYSDRELIALSASGFSKMDIAKPAIKLAVAITFICYLLAFYISPAAFHILKERTSNMRENYISSMIHERTFNQLSKDVVLFVEAKHSASKMEGIIIFDNRNKKSPITVFARLGELAFNNNLPVFELYDGMRQEIDKNGNMLQMQFSHFVITLLPKENARNTLTRDLQEYTIFDLLYPDINHTTQRLSQINLEKHQRMIWPSYVIALVILTLAVYLREPYSRTGHKWIIFKVALAVIVPIYLHFTFINLASNNSIFIILCYINLFATIIIGLTILKQSK